MTVANETLNAVDAPRAITPVPLSTYRLQFNPNFTFADATAIVPYLARLGVGWIYASPYFQARSGSTHGYDVIDPNRLNPEIGTTEDHAEMIAAASARGIGHVLDFVPNHMGVGGSENPWWEDVLAWGTESPYVAFFDIDWYPQRPELHGKVLLPFLGDHYGAVLARGELGLAFDAGRGAFAVTYFEKTFPLATSDYGDILAAAAEQMQRDRAWPLRALSGEFRSAPRPRALELRRELAAVARDDEARNAIAIALGAYRATAEGGLDRLDALLGRQHYRLASWRVSLHEINYRRFFDVNDLAGLRVEDADVLAQTHRFVFSLIESGKIGGLRIDHVDGLFSPIAYCRLLQDRAEALGHPQYLVVEKILAPFESMRADWKVDGTTGYDFMNAVNGLFVDERSELAFDRIYRRFARLDADFEAVAYRAKKEIMRLSLASELTVLASMLDRIAARDRRASDFPFEVLRDGLTETIASFPVYRTYVTNEDIAPEDRRYLEWALAKARRRAEFADDTVFDFIESVLTLEAPKGPNSKYDRTDVLRFAMKFQQYTSPVTAKAVEDTAFYRYVRLASLNEVGGDPKRFGLSPAAFHRQNAERAANFPHGMLATATHDHKRGEDVRTRLDALSELPGLWSRALGRWSRYNERKKTVVDGNPAPTSNDEYLIYQTLLGTWPAEWLNGVPRDASFDTYLERIKEYIRKATREAKFRTSWSNPNVAYEDATLEFVRRTLDPQYAGPFLREFIEVAREVAAFGAISSLAQTVLKLTSPGVPDIYQGTEFWDLSLVDPDNRRPVDYAARDATLAEFEARERASELDALARELARDWHDGHVKAYVMWRLLHLRAKRPDAFLGNSYEALEVVGPRADRVVAFRRDEIVTLVPRLMHGVAERASPAGLRVRFGDERVVLGSGGDGRIGPRYRNLFTGEPVDVIGGSDAEISVARALANFPVAVLVRP